MIAFVIWSIVAAIFLGIGMSGRSSKEAVGFFTFVKPPVVTEIAKYNRTVSRIWIVSAVILEILGIPFLFFRQNSPVFLFVVFGVVILLIGMMIAYLKVEAKYRK